MTTLDETRFHHQAGEAIERLHEALETQDVTGLLDLEGQDGMLTIQLEDRRTFVVSRHTAARELWLSSPISGGLHFRPTPEGGWRLPDGRAFPDLLLRELNQATGQAFHA